MVSNKGLNYCLAEDAGETLKQVQSLNQCFSFADFKFILDRHFRGCCLAVYENLLSISYNKKDIPH